MAWQWRGPALAGCVAAVAIGVWQLSAPARPTEPAPGRFVFEVIESFDAKYLGDSPGHVGRGGGVTGKPNVALGDPVFHGDRKVGKVTGLRWDRAKQSLEVEFDPEPFEIDARGRVLGPIRIAVGEDAWIPLGGPIDFEKTR